MTGIERRQYCQHWGLPYQEFLPKRLKRRERARKTRCPSKDQAKCALRYARTWAALIGNLKDVHKIYVRAAKYRKYGLDVQVDHIIPLSEGGAHSPENLQIIYAVENRRKHTRLDYRPRVIFI